MLAACAPSQHAQTQPQDQEFALLTLSYLWKKTTNIKRATMGQHNIIFARTMLC